MIITNTGNNCNPQALAGQKTRACIVYAHGGGAIAACAELYKGYLAHMALDCQVVVFNVDYRLAPESRSGTKLSVC